MLNESDHRNLEQYYICHNQIWKQTESDFTRKLYVIITLDVRGQNMDKSNILSAIEGLDDNDNVCLIRVASRCDLVLPPVNLKYRDLINRYVSLYPLHPGESSDFSLSSFSLHDQKIVSQLGVDVVAKFNKHSSVHVLNLGNDA